MHRVVPEQLPVALNHRLGVMTGGHEIIQSLLHDLVIERDLLQLIQTAAGFHDDRRERLPQLMRQRRGELAERGQPRNATDLRVRLSEGLVGLPPVGDVSPRELIRPLPGKDLPHTPKVRLTAETSAFYDVVTPLNKEAI